MEEYAKVHDRLGQLLKKDMVFVVGATRWDTSWVQQCLDTHPKACCKGEGHFTDTLFPGLAKFVDQYNQDAENIGNRMQLAGLPGNAAGFTFEDVEYLMQTAFMFMMQRWVPEDEDVSCIGEKTPEHVLSLELLDRLFPNMRIIHVVRDGRDEAASTWNFNMGIPKGEFPRRYPSFADFAKKVCQKLVPLSGCCTSVWPPEPPPILSNSRRGSHQRARPYCSPHVQIPRC